MKKALYKGAVKRCNFSSKLSLNADLGGCYLRRILSGMQEVDTQLAFILHNISLNTLS